VLVLLLAALLSLSLSPLARAAEFAPTAYYNVNPYDDTVLGAGLSWRGQWNHTEVDLGYSTAQSEARGRFHYWNDVGLGARGGFDLQVFHEVQARSDLVPLIQHGFYEGHTGGIITAYRRLGYHEVGMVSLISDRVWPLPARGNLIATERDRVYSLRLAYQRDTREDRFNPRTGGRTEVAATQAARVFGGTRSYLVSTLHWTRYQALGERGALAWRLHTAATAGGLPEQRRLGLPGAGVRGYDFVTAEDRVNDPGTFVTVANAEVRLPVLPRENISLGMLGTLMHLQVAAFADVGTARQAGSSWIVRGGVGLGVRAPLVALGRVPMIVRLDVAQGLTRTGRLSTYVLLTAPELF